MTSRFSDFPNKVIITLYSDCLKNKKGDFIFDSSFDKNIIEKESLESFVQIFNSNTYNINNKSLDFGGVTQIPIVNNNISFNIINSGISSEIIGIFGQPAIKELGLPI